MGAPAGALFRAIFFFTYWVLAICFRRGRGVPKRYPRLIYILFTFGVVGVLGCIVVPRGYIEIKYYRRGPI